MAWLHRLVARATAVVDCDARLAHTQDTADERNQLRIRLAVL